MTDYREWRGKEPMERFVEYIDLLPNGCWQWNGNLVTQGYGKFKLGGVQFRAHRFSYMLYIGDIPADKQLDHLCRNRGCVNPEHLEAVTPQVNQLRGNGVSGLAARRTICPQGHTYDRIYKNRRLCSQCMHVANLKWRLKNANT